MLHFRIPIDVASITFDTRIASKPGTYRSIMGMNTIKIKPKVDFVFRKLYGTEENKDLLISLLNSVIQPDVPITDVRIMNPFNLANYERGKETILDIKAIDENGVWYDVELQLLPHVLYGKRAVYYGAKVFTDQIEQGGDWTALNKTIGIHFLDFRYFDDDRVVHRFVLMDAQTNQTSKELDCLEFYFVELPKFDKDWPQVRTALDRWIAFLNRATELNRLELPAAMGNDPVIAKALSLLERIGLEPTERAIYEGEEKAIMVDHVQIRTAEERGIQQGMQQMVCDQMASRLGDVPPTVSSKLTALSTEDLRRLGMALLDLNSYADVEAWLTRH
jgi:predicted transposase/invertase (TIGR01784 family)